MSIEEYMIGDWVMDTEPTFYTQVTTGMIYEGYDWEPVPLTEEVLMANEFHQCATYSRIWLPKDYLYPQLWREEEAYQYHRIQLDYVHQLQQVLRLCGLNEIANNFKLK